MGQILSYFASRPSPDFCFCWLFYNFDNIPTFLHKLHPLHISDHFHNSCQTPREPKCFCLNVVLTKSCKTFQTSSVVAIDRFSVMRADRKVALEKS